MSPNSKNYFQSYLGIGPEEEAEMLNSIGYNSTIDLFSDVPQNLIERTPINIDGPYSEFELNSIFKKISQKNFNDHLSFLGGGVRDLYIPAFLEELMRRGEIYTAYTSYQPEIAQGMLQLIYEYESQVAELTGMDVISASLYDWATALGESARMMMRIMKRRSILVANPISPERLEVLRTYTEHSGFNIVLVDGEGTINQNDILIIIEEDSRKDKKEREIAGVYFEIPTFHGVLPSQVDEFIDEIHKYDVLVTVGIDLISLGILRTPAEYNADFMIGEGQILGSGVSNGGPLLGILGTKYNRKWIQNFPGRLVGKTTELGSDLPGYCITLSTREQHIRREKATSNICSNQTLMAVNAGIFLAGLGPKGIRDLASGLVDRAHYLAKELNKLEGIRSPVFEPFLFDFVVDFGSISHEKLEEQCISQGILPGLKIEGTSCLRLISVSDKHRKEELDYFVNVISEVSKL